MTEGKHEIVINKHCLPNGKIVKIKGNVLPDDPVVRSVAECAIRRCPEIITTNIIDRFNLRGDYPSQLNVLGFFKAILTSWHEHPGRKVDLSRLLEKVDVSMALMIERSRIERSVQKGIEVYGDYQDTAYSIMEKLVANGYSTRVARTLCMYLDFGDKSEIIAAANITRQLGQQGLFERNLLDSVMYRSKHPNKNVAAASRLAVESLLTK